MSEEPATEQEITIARVVLGGWTFVPYESLGGAKRYEVYDPEGRYVYNASTRYSAACAVEMLLQNGFQLEALLGKGKIMLELDGRTMVTDP